MGERLMGARSSAPSEIHTWPGNSASIFASV